MDAKKISDIVMESERQVSQRKQLDDKTQEKIKMLYNIQDAETIQRLINLQLFFEQTKHVIMSIEQLIIFLKTAINYDDMQIWIMKQKINGVQLSLNDTLKKFFELKTDEEILRQYDVEQNYNTNNIARVRKVLKK